MMLLLNLLLCPILLMMLLLLLMILVHLVTLLRNRSLLQKNSGIEIPDTCYPFDGTYNYPDLSKLKERLLDDDYIILDDDLCRELTEFVDSHPHAINKLIEKHSLKNKTVPDPKFATSPICINDPDYNFFVDLSLISMVEADPFYCRENDDAVAHLTKITELGGLFTTDEKIRNFYVTKLFSFSLKES